MRFKTAKQNFKLYSDQYYRLLDTYCALRDRDPLQKYQRVIKELARTRCLVELWHEMAVAIERQNQFRQDI